MENRLNAAGYQFSSVDFVLILSLSLEVGFFAIGAAGAAVLIFIFVATLRTPHNDGAISHGGDRLSSPQRINDHAHGAPGPYVE